MEKLKILDLFSGLGGISLGLERTGGFETVAFCEIDKPCHDVLQKHWPHVPIFEDVSKLSYDGEYLCSGNQKVTNTKIDVICGGFPCTDISVAGKQKGLFNEAEIKSTMESYGLTRDEAIEFLGDDALTRSGMWTHYKRLIGEVRPSYVVIENVANLRSNGLEVVIKNLTGLGYSGEWHIISARDVGAPHLRERIWIIAWREDEAHENRDYLSVLSEEKRGEESPIPANEVLLNRMFVTGENQEPYKYKSWRSGAFICLGKNNEGSSVRTRYILEGGAKNTSRKRGDNKPKQKKKPETVLYKILLDKSEKDLTTSSSGRREFEEETVLLGNHTSHRPRQTEQRSRESYCDNPEEPQSDPQSTRSPSISVDPREDNNIRGRGIPNEEILDGLHRNKVGHTSPSKIRDGIALVAHPNGESIREQPRGSLREDRGETRVVGDDGKKRIFDFTHSYHFRLWEPASSEKVKQERWAEATSGFRDWWKIKSPVCRVDDVLPGELHTPEAIRKQRIKQLGNSVVPAIPELIGNKILSWEAIRCL